MDQELADIRSGESKDFTPELKAKVQIYQSIKSKAKKDIIDLVTKNATKDIVAYDLLNNNNSNIQDAQYAIIAGEYIIPVNRFWCSIRRRITAAGLITTSRHLNHHVVNQGQ